MLPLNHIGNKFTWKHGNHFERLDSCVANNPWLSLFLFVSLFHLGFYVLPGIHTIKIILLLTLCNGGWESIGHALFRCTRAEAVWNLTHFRVCFPNISNLNGHDIYSSLAAVHNNTDLEKILCLMWCIWTERNKKLHGTKPKPALITCTFTDAYIDQFHIAKVLPLNASTDKTRCSKSASPNSVGTSTTPQVKWLAPAASSYKINVDVEGSVIGIGAIVLDYFGDVITAFLKPLWGCFSYKRDGS
ncbi:hypothetical protein CsatB_020555 [Cannabis sativa]